MVILIYILKVVINNQVVDFNKEIYKKSIQINKIIIYIDLLNKILNKMMVLI